MKFGIKKFCRNNSLNKEIINLQYTSDLLDNYCSVEPNEKHIDLQQVLLSLHHDKVAIKPILLADKSFTDIYGTNDLFWIPKIEASIMVQSNISYENMLLQDLLRFDIPGAILSKYLTSIDRLIARLNNNIYKFKDLDPEVGKELLTQKSPYLPDYEECMTMLDGLETLQSVILEIAGKGNKIQQKDIAKLLKELGISTGENPNLKTNWKMVAGSLTGALVLGVAVSTNPIFLYFGSALTKGLFTRKGRAISSRGWHSLDSLIIASERTVKILYKTKEVMTKLKGLDDQIVGGEISKDAKATYESAGVLLKKSIKAYKQLVVTIGRGLAGVTIERRDFNKGFKDRFKNNKELTMD